MIRGLLCWKDNMIMFSTMCSMKHETLYCGTVLYGKLNVWQTVDTLTSLHLSTQISLMDNPKYSERMPLEIRLDKLSKMSSLTIIAFGNQKL